MVPLSHAGLRARSLAIAGAPTLARATAEQGERFRALQQSCDAMEAQIASQVLCVCLDNSKFTEVPAALTEFVHVISALKTESPQSAHAESTW